MYFDFFTVRTCPALRQIENGRINCTSSDTSYGSVCSVTCKDGYKLEGTSKLVCQGNAQWDAREPRCTGILS